MSFEIFKEKIAAVAKRAGSDIKVRFSTDPETGRHRAECSDGTTITANTTSLRISVRWGSGHHSYASV